MTDPILDGVEALIQRELSRPVIAPGLAPTLWGKLDTALPSLVAVRPDAVILHAAPVAGLAPTVERLRAALPGVRLWLQAPANCLGLRPGANSTDAQAAAKAARWAKAAVALGAELLSSNGEGPMRPGWRGWKPVEGVTFAALERRATAVLAAMQEAAPGLVLAWSSHDCLRSHGLPWGAILGPRSPVRLTLPQHYPATKKRRVKRKEALKRYARAQREAQALAARGVIRPEFIPGGAGALVYTQSYGLTTDAACALLDLGVYASTWAVPTRIDAEGLLALRADAELRRRVGHEPGRIARFQAGAGLVVDGICGILTQTALGVAP